MPLPPPTAAAVDQLLDLYRAAQANLLDEIVRAAADLTGTSASHRQRLAGLLRAVEEEMTTLDAAARTWSSAQLPGIYQLGAEQGAAAIDRQFQWTQLHRDAVQVLAADTFDDLLNATGYVRRDVKAFIRVAARERTAAVVLEGRTATQAGRDLARRLAQRGIAAVVYKNGARHSLADYADTVIRTRAATIGNAGTLNVGAEAGVKYAECFDGAGCGLTSHQDPDTANGSVRTLAVAQAHPTAHPRCSRSWALLPVETRAQAEAVQRGPSTPEDTATIQRGVTAHEKRLTQRQARLDARAAKVRA